MEKILEIEEKLEENKNEYETLWNNLKEEYIRLANECLPGSVIKYRDYLIKIKSITNSTIGTNINNGKLEGCFNVSGEYIINNTSACAENIPFSLCLRAKEIASADKSEKAIKNFDEKVKQLKDRYNKAKDKLGNLLLKYDFVHLSYNDEIIAATVVDYDVNSNLFEIASDFLSENILIEGNKLIRINNH